MKRRSRGCSCLGSGGAGKRSCKNRKTGYKVWIGGQCEWHRTYEGAEKAAVRAQRYSSEVQIDDVRTGRRV